MAGEGAVFEVMEEELKIRPFEIPRYFAQIAGIDFGIAIVLAISMVLMISRLFIGPTLYDRALAVNSFGTKTVLFLAVFSLMVGRGDGLDIALLYALINFIGTIAILKFFRYRNLGVADSADIRNGTEINNGARGKNEEAV